MQFDWDSVTDRTMRYWNFPAKFGPGDREQVKITSSSRYWMHTKSARPGLPGARGVPIATMPMRKWQVSERVAGRLKKNQAVLRLTASKIVGVITGRVVLTTKFAARITWPFHPKGHNGSHGRVGSMCWKVLSTASAAILLSLACIDGASAGGGCGHGFHRGPGGACVPNGGPVVVAPVAPVVVAPAVVAPVVCGAGLRWHPRLRRCVVL
jgi:hypothetical protein